MPLQEDEPVTLAQIIDPTIACNVVVNVANEAGDPVTKTVKVRYYRGRMTKNFGKRMIALGEELAEDEEAAKQELCKLVVYLVKWWNVPVALEEAALAPVDTQFLGEVLQGIVAHNLGHIPGELHGVKQSEDLSGISEAKPLDMKPSVPTSRRKTPTPAIKAKR